eukprot:TRINITY_DN621_c0_g1_i3.p2 TRINITY_DN621_c0_g1~~TRINITY_DN621_c0_g1_i3.p2  ORF type:complete len:148 (-),score=18.49 TRINITY_DN621_c0_g1_i3:1020-1463(-)
MQPCMSSQIFLSRQQALLLVVLLTIYLNFSWAICIGGPHASRGGGGDADGLAHIQGYYQVEDGQFWAEWVESPLDLPVDPESQELDQERLKKVIRKAPFFTLSRLHGNVNGAYLLPYNIEGEYEATTGIKGSIKISSQGGQPSSQVL